MLKALSSYYDVLQARGEVLPEHLGHVKIHYIISLDQEGRLIDLIDCQQEREIVQKSGKVKIIKEPREYIFPKRNQKPAISSNIVEHRARYIFGLEYVNQSFDPIGAKDKAIRSHAAFVETNFEFVEDLNSPLLNAYRNFIDNWNPVDEVDNVHLQAIKSDYNTAGFAFCLDGDINNLLNEDSAVLEKWEKCFIEQEEVADIVLAQDAISGEVKPIARIHPKIKGVRDGQSGGCTLVSFNNESELSYGHKQSYNSNISKEVAFKYSEALNCLLSNNKAHYINGLTVISFASNAKEIYEEHVDLFLFFDNPSSIGAEEAEKLLNKLINRVREGKLSFEQLLSEEDIDPDVDYYIIGLKPNVSRLSLKFIYKKKYGELLMNIARHQEDLRINQNMAPISISQIEKELLSPKSDNDKTSPVLMAKLFNAVIEASPYPVQLVKNIIQRLKTDRKTGPRSEAIRNGIIKAWLNRKARFNGEKEEISMGLNPENTNVAYLLGRLFAVLELLQQSAAKGKLNRTIKDAYFASASTKPASVFPKLVKLAQNHLRKSEYEAYYDKLIVEIFNKLGGSFPDLLSLPDQGRFMIGYYQQRGDHYTKKEKSEEEENAQ